MQMRNMPRLREPFSAAAEAVLILILAGCGNGPTFAGTPAPQNGTAAPTTAASATPVEYWPTEGWRTSTPEAQGMDADKLADMMDWVAKEKPILHSLLIIRHGYIVQETYFEPRKDTLKHDLYSVTKSFVSTLIGIALDQGKIDRIEHRVLDFFPGLEVENRTAEKERMTLEDLLTMRSGLSWVENDSEYGKLYRSGDWVKYMLDLPMADPPGGQFLYCSGCSHLLSAILQESVGENAFAYAKENLFGPVGITSASWESNPAGVSIGGWGLQLVPRDMAKLGYLFLHGGMWDGRQIVSAGWVGEATSEHTGTGPGSDLGYGYQWWIYPRWHGYAALGRYGQSIFVLPDLDLIVVTTAGMPNHDPIFQMLRDYIEPAVIA
jgi:CubicO group peptidase (beta-lactamase class C family)